MASSHNLTPLETWAFRSPFETSFLSEAFARDTQALTKALQNSISGGCDLLNLPLIKPETPSSQQQALSVSSSGGSESETVSKRISRNVVPSRGKITKRKPRASKRSPTTFITADPANFRQMVQQVTGVRYSTTAGSVLKPEPHRLVSVANLNRVQAGGLLPTLDTSAFLLDHHQQVAGPVSTGVGVQGGAGFWTPAVVAEAGGPGFDFDGFSSFPTLESGKVM